MIKVLNIISDTNIGGAGRVILNYLDYADRSRFETSVLLPRGSLLKEPLLQKGAAVYEADIAPDKSFDRASVRILKERIREIDPDIVHTHGSMSGRIAAKKCGRKVVYTRHSAFPVPARLKHGPGRWLNRWMNDHYADRIIAVSPACAENLTDAGVRPEHITTMMNGVKPVPRADEAACRALREKLGIAEGQFVFGILARLEEYKGHLDLLEAVKLLREQGRNPKILIAGTGSFENSIRTRRSELGLEDTVEMLGFVSDVAGLLSILDVQLNASYGTEASSIALLEGMSMGVPVIASRYGGNPFQVDDGEDGLLFETRNPKDLAEKMAFLMDSPQTLARMRGRAKEIFEARFTGGIFAKNVEQVYLTVLKGDSHGAEKD